MKLLGEKEVKQGAKLLLQKEKIDEKIKQLARVYHSKVSVKCDDESYFVAMAKDHNRQMNKKAK